jgi:predicted DNA binding CopG/RHH family protein
LSDSACKERNKGDERQRFFVRLSADDEINVKLGSSLIYALKTVSSVRGLSGNFMYCRDFDED